jgi:hypothetical protein
VRFRAPLRRWHNALEWLAKPFLIEKIFAAEQGCVDAD